MIVSAGQSPRVREVPPTHTTPLLTRISRYAIKIFELFRSLIHPFTHCLSNIDVQRALKDVCQYDFLNRPWTAAEINAEEIPSNPTVIPINLKGLFRNHIVFFAVNPQSQEIIFYDSKGWTLADYGLEGFYQKLRDQFPNYDLFQNTKKEQYDLFNCTVYCIHRIRLLINNTSTPFATSLRSNPLSFSDAMQERAHISARSSPPLPLA